MPTAPPIAPKSPHDLPRMDRVGATGAGALANLHAAVFSPPWRSDDIMPLLSDPGVLAWVSSYQGAHVGFGVFRTVARDEAEILTLGVLPNFRRLGIARRILHHARRELKARHCERLYLEVDAGNVAAIKLYEGSGFEVVASRPKYYANIDGCRSDALVMRLFLCSQ
ncbi:MAG: GNAT family N-acetyltransferase [Hyphomicrobiaceae bacterium]